MAKLLGLRISWVEEKGNECVEGEYLDCMHKAIETSLRKNFHTEGKYLRYNNYSLLLL